MNHVAEIAQAPLIHPETHLPDAGKDVAHVMKQYTIDILSVQRKTQLGVIKKLRGTAQRESRNQVARTRLVFRKTPVRKIAAAEETFSNRNRIGRVRVRRNIERGQNAEGGLSRQCQFRTEGSVRGIAPQHASEVAGRAEGMISEAEVQGVVDAPMRVHRVVPAVLHQVHRKHTDVHGL